MKIAIDISGQFGKMTGIQHYVDSLLAALNSLDTEHELAVLAQGLWSVDDLDRHIKDSQFQWRVPGAVHVDLAGNDFTLLAHPLLRGSRLGRRVGNAADGLIINPYKSRTPLRRISRACARYDLVHIPESHDLSFQKYAVKRSVLTIYDVTPITCPAMHVPGAIAVWRQYFEYARRRAARVITISEFSKADIVEHLGIPADRVDVTPLAPRVSAARITDLVRLQDVRAKFGLEDAPFVLYAGTLEPRKNLARLIEAFAQAVREGRLADHRLVLAGGHWDRHDLEMRLHAYEHEVGKRLVVTGYVSNAEMNALMSSCAAFAYVSEYEGFGLPPLEAMACGAPVVASNTTSLPEVVGDAGITVDPADVGAIAGALHLLLTDCGENARRRGLSLARAAGFSWARTARLTLQSYEAALA